MAERGGAPIAAPNAYVAAAATEAGLLPLGEAALVGVAGPEGAMRALIRLSDGTIIQAAVGERIGLGRLLEVSTAGVVVELASGFATFLRPYPWSEMQGDGAAGSGGGSTPAPPGVFFPR